MEIGLIFGMMLGCVGLGYYLRFWHDAPELAAREEMLEQRIEKMARERLNMAAQPLTDAEMHRIQGMYNIGRRF